MSNHVPADVRNQLEGTGVSIDGVNAVGSGCVTVRAATARCYRVQLAAQEGNIRDADQVLARVYRRRKTGHHRHNLAAVVDFRDSARASAEIRSHRPWNLLSAVPLALALGRFALLTRSRLATPVEDLLTRDVPMLACETAWLALFTAGL